MSLKIRWASYDRSGILADEATLYVPADEVTVHGQLVIVDGADPMNGWEPGSFFEYRSVDENQNCETVFSNGRLIKVRHNDVETWYAASLAWILGPTGSTIERVAP
jgi:hypothetical protein